MNRRSLAPVGSWGDCPIAHRALGLSWKEIALLGWPKTSFGFFHTMWLKTQMDILANSVEYGGFPSGSDGKESAAIQETQVQSGSGRSPGEGDGYPFQFSCLENSTDRGAWRATVRGVVESRTRLSNYHWHRLTDRTEYGPWGVAAGLLLPGDTPTFARCLHCRQWAWRKHAEPRRHQLTTAQKWGPSQGHTGGASGPLASLGERSDIQISGHPLRWTRTCRSKDCQLWKPMATSLPKEKVAEMWWEPSIAWRAINVEERKTSKISS